MHFLRTLMLGLVLAGLASGGPAWAADGAPSKRQKIVSLLKAINILDTIDATVPQITAGLVDANRRAGQDLSPETEAAINDAVRKVMRANLRPYLRALVNIYDQTYTMGEIDDLVAFYQSPTGQKSLEIQPQMMGKMAQTAVKWSRSLEPKLQAEIEKTLAPERFPDPVTR